MANEENFDDVESSLDKFIMYRSNDNTVQMDVYYHEESVWLTQKRMAELFGVDVNTVSEHLQNIFSSSELEEHSVTRNFRVTASDGKKYLTNFYNLDAIISVGYRVNSREATQFRIWATSVLRDYVIKGFVLDESKLKNGSRFGKDYFDELLEKIREIRASERRFYQKITDLFSEGSIDYDRKSEISRSFFAKVQNKLLFGTSGKTAAEIIKERVNSEKENMGLTTWKSAPTGKIIKSDVTVSKNYLSESELKSLNRIVSMYLDYAESQAEKNVPMTMSEWATKLDAFLEFNEMELLQDSGKVTKAVADKLAIAEYEKFRVLQDKTFESDFDKQIKKALEESD